MSDIAKWALLVAGAVALIALIVALPIAEYINPTEFGNLIGELASLAGDVFQSGRGIVNNFLTPFGITVLSGLIIWLLAKGFLTMGIKIGVWVYNWIFK